jgi:hypothetical protein
LTAAKLLQNDIHTLNVAQQVISRSDGVILRAAKQQKQQQRAEQQLAGMERGAPVHSPVPISL